MSADASSHRPGLERQRLVTATLGPAAVVDLVVAGGGARRGERQADRGLAVAQRLEQEHAVGELSALPRAREARGLREQEELLVESLALTLAPTLALALSRTP